MEESFGAGRKAEAEVQRLLIELMKVIQMPRLKPKPRLYNSIMHIHSCEALPVAILCIL